MDLLSKKCIPCESGRLPMDQLVIEKYMPEADGWVLAEKDGAKRIEKEYKFKDFKEAVSFVNKIAELAESEGHHPNIYVAYSKVKLELWTHAIGGLSENDFILAAKIDRIFE